MCDLGKVAGNHSRFLFDFSPESIVLRITHDPAPRILYCFELDPNGELIAPGMVTRVRNRDIEADELFIGGPISSQEEIKHLDGVHIYDGVKRAVSCYVDRLKEMLKI